jgi:hypothetical protein
MHATLREYEGIKDPVEALAPLRAGLLVAAQWVERWRQEHPTTAPTDSRVDAGPVVASAPMLN